MIDAMRTATARAPTRNSSRCPSASGSRPSQKMSASNTGVRRAGAPGAHSRSPRSTITGSAKVNAALSPACAESGGRGHPSSSATCARWPEGSTITSSPGHSDPCAIRPATTRRVPVR